MIRLIASDIDGTLLQNGAMEIPPEIFGHIRRLEKRGILFCPASGRQYSSLRRLFAPAADQIPFLCENGAVVYGPGSPGPILSKTAMDRRLSLELCREILAIPGAEVLISGADVSYLCPKAPDLEEKIRWFLGNRTAVLPAPENAGASALEGQGGGVGGHIGAALINNGDDAHGDTALPDGDAVGPLHRPQHLPYRVR